MKHKVGAMMSQHFYTVGMAGHIDHGKTSLTKALTNVDTDRLKEEKERKITIELGYAPFQLDDMQASIIDVPGHEKFIRQMIAGVAGIDLVLLVIAADEGVMPQTKEHLHILTYLGINEGIVVVTKADKVDEEFLELVKEDISEVVKHTAFEESPILFVDNITHKGIEDLKNGIKEKLQQVPSRSAKGEFRFPIDQVFSLQGKGTIVRGTVYEGTIKVGQEIYLLPSEKTVKVKNIHVHNKEVEEAFAGQRAAINVSLARDEVERGDVLVSALSFPQTTTVDLALTVSEDMKIPLKQRAPIKFHAGTTELMGNIVFFDRNELTANEKDVLCQVRLEAPIVLKRGDRFVLRRPTPVETLGGGWVIDPYGEKYRFSNETIDMLKQKMIGTPDERILATLTEEVSCTIDKLAQITAIAKTDLQEILTNLESKKAVYSYDNMIYVSKQVRDKIMDDITSLLVQYHKQFPMRPGMNKAEVISALSMYPKRIVELILEDLISEEILHKDNQYLKVASHEAYVPKQWSNRVEHVLTAIKKDGLNAKKITDYFAQQQIPESLHQEFKRYFIETTQLLELEENLLVHTNVYEDAIAKLREQTETEPFTVQDAKSILNLTRKGIIPLLEMLDKKHITKRVENERHWLKR